MPEQDFHVEFNDKSVDVRLSVSEHSPNARFYACGFFVATWAVAICALLFLPGKRGSPSMWHDLSSSPVDSGDFIVPLVILFGISVLIVLLTRRYVVLAYPSDEIFHFDGLTLTISKVRWLDIHNTHWDTYSCALPDI